MKFWKVKNVFRLDDVKDFTNHSKLSLGVVFKAWLPFILLIACIVVWTQDWFKAFFKKGSVFDYTQVTMVFKNMESAIQNAAGNAVNLDLAFNLIALQGGTAILLAAVLTILFLRIKLNVVEEALGDTLKEMAIPCITIGLVVAFAFISRNSGMSETLGRAFAESGNAFAFFSPIVGWLGVFIMGSDTSSNLLFGTLQQVSAQQLGIKEALFLAANSVGGVVGKMISPQSIAIACAAVGLVGRESELFRFTLKYSIGFILIIGVWTAIIALFLNGIIPDVVPLAK